MKKTSLVYALFFASLTLASCAKTDSDFAARYAKNKAGASAVDTKAAGEAGEAAANQGLQADIVAINKNVGAYGPGSYEVTANILINDLELPVKMTHPGATIVEGKTMVSNYTVVFHGSCPNYACNPYYAAMEVYQNQTMIVQVGLRKYFAATTDQDKYQFFKPEEALSFTNLITYLNSAGTVATTSTSAGIIQ